MDFANYLAYFDQILNSQSTDSLPQIYQDADYLEYTKLNWSRINRWMKTGKLTIETIEKLKSITTPQKWIVITEPWCGDASHIIPFIELMAQQNPNIELDYELRDASPYRIDKYLTNGSKSIPILIIQDPQQQDLAIWGPRPAKCQEIFIEGKKNEIPMTELKLELQKWYNQDKGIEIQREIIDLL